MLVRHSVKQLEGGKALREFKVHKACNIKLFHGHCTVHKGLRSKRSQNSVSRVQTNRYALSPRFQQYK